MKDSDTIPFYQSPLEIQVEDKKVLVSPEAASSLEEGETYETLEGFSFEYSEDQSRTATQGKQIDAMLEDNLVYGSIFTTTTELQGWYPDSVSEDETVKIPSLNMYCHKARDGFYFTQNL